MTEENNINDTTKASVNPTEEVIISDDSDTSDFGGFGSLDELREAYTKTSKATSQRKNDIVNDYVSDMESKFKSQILKGEFDDDVKAFVSKFYNDDQFNAFVEFNNVKKRASLDEAVGSPQDWPAIISWCDENLEPDEIEFYNNALDRGHFKVAIKMVDDYNKANSVVAKPAQKANDNPTPTNLGKADYDNTTTGFASKSEMQEFVRASNGFRNFGSQKIYAAKMKNTNPSVLK